MKSKNHIALFFVTGITSLVCMQCGNKHQAQDSGFTQIDSLTEVYLILQDSLHDTWSMMMHDDNEKIKAMKGLLHELKIGSQFDPQKLQSLDQRIDQLITIRYTLKTMHNGNVVEEYDFASNSLITELISLAESLPSFSYNTTIQKLVEEIRASDLRVENYRIAYDSVALEYNRFLEEQSAYLKEITDQDTNYKKPMFGMAE